MRVRRSEYPLLSIIIIIISSHSLYVFDKSTQGIITAFTPIVCSDRRLFTQNLYLFLLIIFVLSCD